MTNGGGRYWNEEAQRWEDGATDTPRVTLPPPAPPDREPFVPQGAVGDPDARTGEGNVPAPSPGRHPSGGHGSRTVRTVVAAAAGVGIAVGLVVTVGFGGDSGDQDGAPPSSAPPAAAPSPWTDVPEESGTDIGTDIGTDPATDTPTPTAAEPPGGYTTRQDPEGFRIAVPDGWLRTAVGSRFGMDVVNYRSASGDRRIQVYQVAESTPEESVELYLSSDVAKPPGFRVLKVERVDAPVVGGTRMEYVADSLKGETGIGVWHVYDQRFESEDGKVYAVASYGPDVDGGTRALRNLTTALKWFCPPEGHCPASP
ncbi:hypothetical protein GCM10022384_03400 [Streptomyces marokkonensis]|uniref:Fibronectin attachment protein n=1 Tax=Streptomyces marokkonensis TaxID=324855 RepID=A0ABP7NSK2_9ACTN